MSMFVYYRGCLSTRGVNDREIVYDPGLLLTFGREAVDYLWMRGGKTAYERGLLESVYDREAVSDLMTAKLF